MVGMVVKVKAPSVLRVCQRSSLSVLTAASPPFSPVRPLLTCPCLGVLRTGGSQVTSCSAWAGGVWWDSLKKGTIYLFKDDIMHFWCVVHINLELRRQKSRTSCALPPSEEKT